MILFLWIKFCYPFFETESKSEIIPLDEHAWEKPPLGRSFTHRGHVLRARELCPLRIHRRRLQNQNPLIGVWWGPSSPSPLQSRQTWQNTPSAPLQKKTLVSDKVCILEFIF